MNIDIKRKYTTKSGKRNYYIWLKLDDENVKIGTFSFPQENSLGLLSKKLNSFKVYRFNKALEKFDPGVRRALWFDLLEKINLLGIQNYPSLWKANNQESAKTYWRRWYYSHRNKVIEEWRRLDTTRGEYKPPPPGDKKFWPFIYKVLSKSSTSSK